MGANNVKLLAIAEKHLGEGGARFRRYCGMSGGAWCCAFVTYIFNEGNDSPLFYGGKKVTYCPTAIKWCEANLAQIPLYLAMPSDIIFFDWEPNGTPNHIGFVKERKSASEIYTIEGNTSGGIVDEKERTEKYVQGIFRPHFKPTKYSADKKLEVDGYFGYNSIAVMQRWVGVETDAILGKITVKALQKKLGVAQDGSWGKKTSRALQKLIGADVDGYFGEKSVKAFQTYLNKQVFEKKSPAKAPAKTKADQINATALKFAWKVGTPVSKYAKNGGSPCPAFIKAWKKYFPHRKINTGCHSYVMLVLKDCGYPTMPLEWSKILKYLRKHFKELKVDFTQEQLKAGDIRVHKNDKGGHHIWIIVKEDGKYYRAEANQGSEHDRYAHINTHNGGNLKHHAGDWLFRAR